MNLIYSICYPDKGDIDYFTVPITEDEVLQLITDFDWKTELEKTLVHYAPSIDFIRLGDKKRIIVSGIGDGILESFQIMYIKPEHSDFIDIFDEANYTNAVCYTKHAAIEEGFAIIDDFLKDEEILLISKLEKDGNEARNPSIIIKDRYPLSDSTTFQALTDSEVNGPFKNFEDHSAFAQLLFRMLGPLVILLFFGLSTYIYTLTGTLDPLSLIFGMVGFFFLIGTVIFEFNLRRK